MIKTQTKTNIITTTALPQTFADVTSINPSTLIPTTTMPTTVENNVVIAAGVGISIKIALASAAATSPILRVVGWNKNPASGYWIPVSLGMYTPTLGGPVDNGYTYASSWSPAVAGGAVVLAGSTSVPATLIVHLQGSEFIQLSLSATAAGIGHIIHVGTI